MTTTHQKHRSRSGFAAAAMLAGILAASALGRAAPANAAGMFLALAYQQSYGSVNSSTGTPISLGRAASWIPRG
jgi:hypothetical protein